MDTIIREQRFLLVGGFNTVFNWTVFSGIVWALGPDLYLWSLWIMYVTGSVVGFTLYRKFVFEVTGKRWKDFLRFQSVSVVPFVVNIFFLVAIIRFLKIDPVVGQSLFVVLSTTWSYLGHRFFSFKR